MRRSLLKTCLMIVSFGSLATAIGCYETVFRLAPASDAKVDRDLCGDWKLKSADGSEIVLGVRNIDDRVYSVSWRNVENKRSLHMFADSTLVQGVRFVHARAMPEDGSLSDTHLILRADLDGDHLTIRNLNEEFLQARKIESDDALRAEIEANLENNDLYDDVAFSGERMQDEE